MLTSANPQRRSWVIALLALGLASLSCLSVASAIPTGDSIAQVDLGGGSSSQISASSPNPCEIDVDFGPVPIGETETAAVKVENVGSSYLDLSPVDPTLDPEFGVKFGPQDTIYPGDAGTFSVTFQPYKTGQVAASFTIQTDANNPTCPNPSQLTIALTGNGIQLSLVVQPDVVDFGNTLINTTSQKSVTLINKSSAPVTGLSTTISGSDANLFRVLDAPTSIAANSLATVNIAYAPLSLETRSLANVIFAGADGEQAKLSLFGEPVAEALTLSPNPCDFGYVPLGSTAVCCSTVANQANIAVTIESISSFATAGNAFALATTDDATPPNQFALPITIGGGGSAKVCFAFTPPITQQYQGDATLISDDPSGTNPIIQLTGWGGGPQISCTPMTVGFGLDHSPSTAIVVCTNSGTAIPGANLILEPPTASPADFTASFDANDDPYPLGGLAPGQSVQIDVTYTSTGTSDEKGTLFIKSNSGNDSTLEIPLTGNGGLDVPPCQFVIAPSALDFTNVPVVGTSTTLSVEIQNVGSNSCSVTNLTIQDDPTDSFHILSTSIAPDPVTGDITIPSPGGSTPSNLAVSLDFAPTTQSQEFSAELTFSISDPSAPNQVVQITIASQAADGG